jgi:multicomponent Na+:H+ antiporter subunit G
MMTHALDKFTVIAVSVGAFFFLAGTVGLLRFPDALTRLHALTKVDNLGLGLIVLGLLPRTDGLLGALKLITVWLLVQLSSAMVAQLIAPRGATRRAAAMTGVLWTSVLSLRCFGRSWPAACWRSCWGVGAIGQCARPSGKSLSRLSIQPGARPLPWAG